jgi:hypothetical protein
MGFRYGTREAVMMTAKGMGCHSRQKDTSWTQKERLAMLPSQTGAAQARSLWSRRRVIRSRRIPIDRGF